MQIRDDRFLSALARRFLGRSHVLDGCAIEIVDYASSVAGIEVRLANGACPILTIAWVSEHAEVLPGSSFLTADDLAGLEEAFDLFISRFLRKHGVIDARGHSTHKRFA